MSDHFRRQIICKFTKKSIKYFVFHRKNNWFYCQNVVWKLNFEMIFTGIYWLLNLTSIDLQYTLSHSRSNIIKPWSKIKVISIIKGCLYIFISVYWVCLKWPLLTSKINYDFIRETVLMLISIKISFQQLILDILEI